MPSPDDVVFRLPIAFDLGATFLLAITGSWAALRRDYDLVGVFVLALVAGAGGGLLRDVVFIRQGPPALIEDARYLIAVGAGAIVGVISGRLADRFEQMMAGVDALGLGAYAVVGAQAAIAAGFARPAVIVVSMSNAVGGGLLRDVLVRQEPLIFKPGQFYALAALAGCLLFIFLEGRERLSIEWAGAIGIAATFALRMLAMRFNWQTRHWRRGPPGDGDASANILSQ